MRISALLALALLCDSAYAQRIITSLTAGNGDGGPATATRFALLGGMAFDALGNLYFSERGAHAIRRITPSGIISTYAGNGQTGFGVSDVAATSTSVESPNTITLDSRGNLFIVDTTRERIRRVSPNGVISTLVSGVRPESIAVDAAGNLYFADPGNARIRRIDPAGIINTFAGNGTAGFSGDGGPATSATISYPTGIAFDSAGNLLFCDRGNNRIRASPRPGSSRPLPATAQMKPPPVPSPPPPAFPRSKPSPSTLRATSHSPMTASPALPSTASIPPASWNCLPPPPGSPTSAVSSTRLPEISSSR